MAEQYRASEAGRIYAATEQDLNPRMKLMLERVRKRARLAAATPPADPAAPASKCKTS